MMTMPVFRPKASHAANFPERARRRRALYPRRLIVAVAAFGVGIAVAVMAALAVTVAGNRTEAMAAAQASTENLVRALTDSTARSMQSIDVTLSSTAEMLKDRGLVADDPVIAAALRDRLAFTPHLRQLVVTDLGGRVLQDTTGTASGLVLDVSPYLAAHGGERRHLYIGRPEQRRFLGGRAGGALKLIPMSRPFENAEGRPAGFILAAVNPHHFQSMLSALDLGPRARVSLHLYGGATLADSAASDGNGPDGAATRLFTEHLPKAEFGSFIDTGRDGVERIVSYRSTPVWPMVVEVGVATDTVLAAWRQNLWSVGLPVAAVAMTVLAMTAALVLSLVRRARDEEALARAEAQLRRSLDEAARMNTELERFSEILAHHLQEPVRRIVSYLQLLRNVLGNRLPADAEECIAFAVAGGRRIKTLLRDVELYLSVDRHPRPDAVASGDGALDTALRHLASRIDAAGARITRGPLARVAVEERRLADVFLVLLENALVYRHPARPIDIAVEGRAGDGVCEFRVRDNGIGIAPEHHEKVFRVFERLYPGDPDPNGDETGTGIGLALARKIVEKAGGRMWLASRPDEGTEVLFTLPLVAGPESGGEGARS